MATLTEQAEIAEDPAFIRRVRQAMVKAATDVAAEAENTENHADRVALSSAVLALPNAWAQNFALGVANHWGIGLGTSDDPAEDDEAMQFAVNSLWNAFAG